jgi:hypothetical protein
MGTQKLTKVNGDNWMLRGAQKIMGKILKVVWAKFSTLS